MSSRFDGETRYEIRVRGKLDKSWSDWLNGATMAFEDDASVGEITVLAGYFDQAALRGLLSRLWDLNLMVERVIHLDNTRGDNDSDVPIGATEEATSSSSSR